MKTYIVKFAGMHGDALQTEVEARSSKHAAKVFSNEWNDGQVPNHFYTPDYIYCKGAPMVLTAVGFRHRNI